MNTETVYMLTTLDNPYNPFTQYKEWYGFDVSSGYNTCSYLARIVKTSDELSKAEEVSAILSGMNEIISENITGLYVKVSQEAFIDRSKLVKQKTTKL